MEVRDSIYSFEIARRAVGRAAVHLGIDSMSEAALDVLADVLLNYLDRVGRTLSHLVEASGRTSAHANVLDALLACELEASSAVKRLHLRDDNGDDVFAGTGAMAAASGGASVSAATASRDSNQLSSDWKGLASFLFGPKWIEEKTEEDDEPNQPRIVQPAAGGKQGPSATDDPSNQPTKKTGWDAPYLDEVPPFPQASQECANPHPLSPYVGLSLHRAKEDDDNETIEATEEEQLDQIPDKVFTDSSWGNIAKRLRVAEISEAEERSTAQDVVMEDATDTSPPKKKVKTANGKSKVTTDSKSGGSESAAASGTEAAATQNASIHYPFFYPPLPIIKEAYKESRTVVDVQPIQRVEKDDEGSQEVRSSLVQLGNYWGSGWNAPSNIEPSKSLAVPLGRRDAAGASATVIPVDKPSGSRVSKILEGSLDAAAMQ